MAGSIRYLDSTDSFYISTVSILAITEIGLCCAYYPKLRLKQVGRDWVDQKCLSLIVRTAAIPPNLPYDYSYLCKPKKEVSVTI